MQELFLICGNKEASDSFLPTHSLISLALVTRSWLSAALSIQAPRPWLHPGFFFYLFMAQHGMHACMLVASALSDSVRPHGQQPTRVLSPQDPLGKDTGVGCHFLGSQPQVPSDPSLNLSSKEADSGQLSNSWANSSV